MDQYDADVLDDEEYESMTREQREAAEKVMEEREARGDSGDRQAQAEDMRDDRFAGLEDDDDEYETLEDGQRVLVEGDVNLEAFDVPLREWIAQGRTRNAIKRRFEKFLKEHRVIRRDGSQAPVTYLPKIRAMCADNSCSLTVSYSHICSKIPILAIWLADVPREMLQIFDEVLNAVTKSMFPNYEAITKSVHVRITDIPLSDKIRDLRQGHLNCLIKVVGVVTRRTTVFPQLIAVCYDCQICGALVGPFSVNGGIENRPGMCPSCQAAQAGCLKINPGKSTYGNYQKITLQESPGSVPPGRVPRYKDVILLGDLIDIVRPGEEVEITGIYMHSVGRAGSDKNGFPVFSTQIEANCVQKKSVGGITGLTDEDKNRIRRLSQEPDVIERIIKSIAPSIYGQKHPKTALACALFGGCAKDSGTHRVRGDVNVLLLGDPGTAKSQLLKYAEKIAPRSVYTTGKGASAVGLTAGVHKDPMTKEWTLEGGALVLADQGVCLIDEFDKMNEQDRTSIHEAMEQQTISVSKAGIITSLQARCSVIAAANPIGGRYDPSYTFAENVELTDPILQRFDVLCVLQDLVDPVIDEQLATFVVGSHMKSHPDGAPVADDNTIDADVDVDGDLDANGQMKNNARIDLNAADEGGPPPLDQDTLKKYIMYAKAYLKPVLVDVNSEKVASLYADMRQQSIRSGGVPIAVRHIESIMRMSEAFARMNLRDHVRDDDVDRAIKVTLESFLQAQKVSVRKGLSRNFRKYITYGDEHNQLLMHQLQSLVRDAEKFHMLVGGANPAVPRAIGDVEVWLNDLKNKAKELNIHDLTPFFASKLFVSHGFAIDENRGVIIKSFGGNNGANTLQNANNVVGAQHHEQQVAVH